ncbi:hypothetical protein ACFV2X_48000 [Streptomyces sp. NPDC059679]|uniref:hypothetical protein n=1 Tax=Streptomyces sp. NPDC059679 TaxID=3346903 RepID=UPI0036D0E722
MPTTSWHGQFASAISAFSSAADSAKTDYKKACTAADAAKAATLHANHPGTAHRTGSRRPYSPYATVREEIYFSHRGLVLSLSRVWYRAAHAYAYAVTDAHRDINLGRTPTATTARSSSTPVPILDAPALREIRERADQQQQRIEAALATFTADFWDEPALAWHEYATAAEVHLWQRLEAVHGTTTAR